MAVLPHAEDMLNTLGELRGFAALSDPAAWIREAARAKTKGREALTALICDCAQVTQAETDAGGALTGEYPEGMVLVSLVHCLTHT